MNPVAIDRRIALAVGSLVLGGVLATGWWLVTGRPGDVAPTVQLPAAQQPTPSQQTGLLPALGRDADGAALVPASAIAARADLRPRVRGVVQFPDGRPAPGASVTLYRQHSAWPEWRREAVDSDITRGGGTFEFASEPAPDLLVGFEHSDFAGGLEPAPLSLPALELRLQRGFEVQGIVTNDAGSPMANVRVAIESTLLEERRVLVDDTDNSGRFLFRNVAAGAIRVVARHDVWQPAVLPNVVVGDDLTLPELRFDRNRPALSLDGRVVAAATQEPVADATVLALPPGQQLGRHDPVSAKTRADGSFRLAGLSRGNLRLEVRHADFATVARTIVVGPSPSPLTFDLPARSQVRGSLLGMDPATVRGSLLLLRSSADEVVSTPVQDNGTFVFPSGVTPGWATLSVPDGRFAFAGAASVLQLLVKEQSGAVAFELDVGPPAEITGRVADVGGRPIAGARLSANQVELVTERLREAGSALIDRDLRRFGDQLARSAGGSPELLLAVSAADGSFRIAGLRPGTVELRVARAGFGSKRLTFDVPPCGETRSLPVEMARGCRIAGLVTRGGRPLPGVQVGVVVDGLAVSAVTGDNGRYELVDLRPGGYRVRARYSTLAASDAAQVAPEAPATVDFVFQPGRTVRGLVNGREGQPIEGARVLVRGDPGNQVRTDSNGAFELEAPRRDVELQVVYGDRGVRHTVPVAATAEGPGVITIDAPPNCTITARVLGLPGKKQLPGVLLRVAPAGDAAAVQSRWIELQAGQLRDPWFPAGRSQVTFWAEGYAPVVRDVQLAAGEEHAFGELLLEPGCELRGVVLDDAGRPVQGAQVFLGEEIDLEVFPLQTRTYPDGAFRVGGVAVAAATLVVWAPGYARQSVRLRLPQDVLAVSPLVVRVERGSKIEVKVASGGDGDVMVLRRNGRKLATAEVDEDGRAVFDHCAPGDYVVHRFGDEQQQVEVRVESSGTVVPAAL